MKKSLVLTLFLMCLILITGCKNNNPEVYNLKGIHDSFEINECSLTIYDNAELFKGGTLKITRPEEFEDVVSCSMSFYIPFEDGTNYTFCRKTLDDLSNSSELDGQSLGRLGSENGPIKISELYRNFDGNVWFELKTKDGNGIVNKYQVQMKGKNLFN